MIRSFLFVPGDSARKLEKAFGTSAGALIIDLEDAVAPDNKQAARDMTREFLDQPRGDKKVPTAVPLGCRKRRQTPRLLMTKQQLASKSMQANEWTTP